MRPNKPSVVPQLFQARLDQILKLEHPLIVLSDKIDWAYFENEFGIYYSENRGRSGVPTRLMVGLHYLKNTFDLSDESVVAHFVENPYWQYFCGYQYFQHEFPIDPSSLTRWRQRVGEGGIERLLKELATAKRSGHLKRHDVNKVNCDTTVQEKAIAFPTDARLYHKMRLALVRAAETRNIKLRQSYRRVGKQALAKQGRYSHARQMKRSKKMSKKLKTYLGCVTRDIKRKYLNPMHSSRNCLPWPKDCFYNNGTTKTSSTVFMLLRLNASQKVRLTSVMNLVARLAWLPAHRATGYLASAPFMAILMTVIRSKMLWLRLNVWLHGNPKSSLSIRVTAATIIKEQPKFKSSIIEP